MKRPLADLRAVLLLAVVVARDDARADVRLGADLRVSQVREVQRLDARGAAPRSWSRRSCRRGRPPRARSPAGSARTGRRGRADRSARLRRRCAARRRAPAASRESSTRVKARTSQPSSRTVAPSSDTYGCSTTSWREHDVGSDAHGVGVQHGDAGVERPLDPAAVLHLLGGGQVAARVHSPRLAPVLDRHRGHAPAPCRGRGSRRRRSGRTPGSRGSCAGPPARAPARPARSNRRPALTSRDLPLTRRGDGELHDALHVPARVPHDPPERARLRRHERREREVEAVLALALEECAQGLDAQERRVARQHEDGPRALPEGLEAAPRGVSGSERRILDREGDGATLEGGRDRLPARPDDDDDPLRPRPSAEARTASSSVRPATLWSTLGRADRIRDPSPAARTMTRGAAEAEARGFAERLARGSCASSREYRPASKRRTDAAETQDASSFWNSGASRTGSKSRSWRASTRWR